MAPDPARVAAARKGWETRRRQGAGGGVRAEHVDEVVTRYVDHEQSLAQIADDLGYTTKIVRTTLSQEGVTLRKGSRSRSSGDALAEARRKGWETRRKNGNAHTVAPDDLAELIRLYAAGRSLRQIAAVMYYGDHALRDALVRAGVKLRARGGRPNEVRVSDEEIAQCVALYQSGLTMEQVAERLGIGRSAVRHRLAYLAGIPLRNAGSYVQPSLAASEVQTTIDLYCWLGMTLKEVAHAMGLTPTAVHRRLESRGIPRRPAGANVHSRAVADRRASACKGWETRRRKAEQVAAGGAVSEDTAPAPRDIRTARKKRKPRMKQLRRSDVFVPSRQLAMAIDGTASREGELYSDSVDGHLEVVCARLGMSHRTVYAWRTGERPHVGIDVADRVLTGLESLWWDVWNEATVRRPLIVARTYAPRLKSNGRGAKRPIVERGERHYGDAGPDFDTLREVENAWEGDREEATAA